MTYRLEDTLRKYPMLGLIFATWAAIQPFIDAIVPVFSAISAVFGAVVIFYTLRIKLIEYDLKKKELRRQEILEEKLKKDLE